MYYFRIWIGSAMFALGVAGVVWFIRNLFRGRTRQALGFSERRFKYLILIVAFLISGLWMFSDFERTPLIGLLAGILLGWFISR